MSILVVDNHDSFVHTLIGYLHELGAQTHIVDADAALPSHVDRYAGVMISPGPGTPEEAGASIAVARECAARSIPLLGVCLGHQVIAVAFGASVSVAPELYHGITSRVWHDASLLYRGLENPFVATRYHSLAIEAKTLPAVLAVTARTENGEVMGIAHRTAPVYGVQFHPESVLTEGGYRLLGNWLTLVGYPSAAERGALLHPHRRGTR